MKREVIITRDGSKTIYFPSLNESYHSRHGALQEALHVYIEHGFNFFKNQDKLHILEIGFGTGLNSILTFLEGLKNQQKINYTGLDLYPITNEEFISLNYTNSLLGFYEKEELEHIVNQVFYADWEKEVEVVENQTIKKIKADFLTYNYPNYTYDLIYFDAFGARVQPELWTKKLLQKMYNTLKNNGKLTTYAAKGSVKRDLLSVGFKVDKFPGPPGKREMMVATKIV